MSGICVLFPEFINYLADLEKVTPTRWRPVRISEWVSYTR